MPKLDSYLFFNGNCTEAMRFYHHVLGGELQPMMTYAQSPDPQHCAPGDKDKVMHACLVLDGRMLMASDMPAQQGPATAGAFALSLNYDTAAEARRVFDVLSAGGTVSMPVAKTFWTEAFGMLTDRFGIPWMVGGGACST